MLVSFFLDGGFVKQKWREKTDHYPTAEDVHTLCVKTILGHPELEKDTLFRIFFYDCYPYTGWAYSPQTGEDVDYSQTISAQAQLRFLKSLGQMPHTAIRAGELDYKGIKISRKIDLSSGSVTLQPSDLVPDFQQKQVDIKIGLDIAWTAIKRIVGKIVLIAGDSDLIPAMKFARKEGILVYLVTFGHQVKGGMIEHSDVFLDDVGIL